MPLICQIEKRIGFWVCCFFVLLIRILYVVVVVVVVGCVMKAHSHHTPRAPQAVSLVAECVFLIKKVFNLKAYDTFFSHTFGTRFKFFYTSLTH